MNPKDVVIRDGDHLAARCTMYNRHNADVRIGGSGDDEMCNFYMIFWMLGELPPTLSRSCWASGTSGDDWATKPRLESVDKAPLEASVQPPLGPGNGKVVLVFSIKKTHLCSHF